MVELFDVANGKIFQMGILNFGGMLASKTKQTKKQKQTTTRKRGGERGKVGADVNSFRL